LGADFGDEQARGLLPEVNKTLPMVKMQDFEWKYVSEETALLGSAKEPIMNRLFNKR
jgi:hypothetical protein